MMTSLLDEMMEEAGVQILFNTIVFDAFVEDGRIKGVAIANKSGGQIVLADVVIDASADGDIAARAGVPFNHGREEDGRHHGGSMDMQIGGIDIDRLIAYLRAQPNLTVLEELVAESHLTAGPLRALTPSRVRPVGHADRLLLRREPRREAAR